jgi:hypothetical protein
VKCIEDIEVVSTRWIVRCPEPFRKICDKSYIGVNLEPGLNTTVSTITTPTYSSGVAGLNGVIMIVFAAMIIFGVVKQMSAAA